MLINLPKNKTYLLACSFGPDSMALFHMLLKAGHNFAVAHVNYQMRGSASDLAAAHLRNYTEANNIAYYEFKVNGKLFKGNFQAEARKARYTFFKKIVSQNNFDALLTAHHEDDHLETYLMQLEQKKRLFYYGIKNEITYEGMTVKRPLLLNTKQHLETYILTNNIPHEIDASNLEDEYLRNKIRHTIINKLTSVERTSFLQEIKAKNMAIDTLKARISALFNKNKVSLTSYLKLNDEEKEVAIYMLFALLNIEERYSGGVFVNINNTIHKKISSTMFKVYENYYFVKAYSYFTIIDRKKYQHYAITVKAPKLVINEHFTANLTTNEAIKKFSLGAYPLTITTASKSDTYAFKEYEKKVNRMFVDMKMPRHLRLVWPIVKDKDGVIIFVPRYREAHKVTNKDIFIINT